MNRGVNDRLCRRLNHYLLLGYLLLFLLSSASVLAQQGYYIGSNLQLGIHTQASLDSPVSQLISSGTPVELLENGTDFSRVKTLDGQEGWIKTQFLTQTEPASVQVEKMEQALQALSASTSQSQEKSLSDTEKTAYEKTIRQLKEELRAWEQLDAQDKQAQKIQAEKANQELRQRLSMIAALAQGQEPTDGPFSLDALISLPDIINHDDAQHGVLKLVKKNYLILLIIAGLSFLFGIFIMDVINRRRHGGYRV